ncbi:hypothetical protein ACFP1Z_27535 [Streptomyces gamaensis]|uniref:Uncharacterized protein n=1 Tax=Streptomyces gamaensis TaxID=1763542 RepID=A0ABW0Z7Z6_9ACTN
MSEDKQQAQGGGGGISIGRMTGGAVASGERARAEDRSERLGAAAPGAGPAPVPAATPGPGGIAVGELSGGAVAAGTEAEAVHSARELVDVSPELFAALRLLRGEQPAGSAAAGELDELTETAHRTGRVERGRLARLRAALTGGAATVEATAAGIAVAEAISHLLA